MPRYRPIDPRIWTDEKFRLLSDDAKLLFFFVLTSPRTNMIGLYVQGQADMAECLGWSPKRFGEPFPKRLLEPFRELLNSGMVKYDETTRLLWLPRSLKYAPLDNENQAKAAIKLVDELPVNASFFQALAEMIEQLGKPFLKPLAKRLLERLPEPFPEPFAKPVPVPGPVPEPGEILPSASPPRPSPRPEALQEIWNRHAERSRKNGKPGLVMCRYLTGARRRKAVERLRESELAWHEVAIGKVAASPFCCGVKGWRASFDWYVRNEQNSVRAYEGAYDEKA